VTGSATGCSATASYTGSLGGVHGDLDLVVRAEGDRDRRQGVHGDLAHAFGVAQVLDEPDGVLEGTETAERR
jgi:hypothetical protein